MPPSAATATLLVSCPDQRGLVAKLGNFIFDHGGNIVHADHHTDFSMGLFLSRIEWGLEEFDLAREEIPEAFGKLAGEIRATWQLHFSSVPKRIAIWVTREDHCLLDLLWRQQSGEFRSDLPLIVSNRENLEPIAKQFGIEFHAFPMTKENKPAQEAKQIELMKRHRIDLVILAKYMQILTPEFLKAAPPIINIHHSFLPAFPGAQPYHRAFDRGVKIIGATAHYVTEDLDEGPIIEQDVTRVTHRDDVGDLIRKGKDLERTVLAGAVRYHLENRILVYGNRTVVFA